MNSSDQKIREIVESYFDQEIQPRLLDQLETLPLKGGEWLFREGDAGDSLYFLVRGRMQVWAGVNSPDSERKPQLLGEVVPGESVGEVGLISDKPRMAGIQAIRDSLLIRIGRTDFQRLAEQHPALLMKLTTHVGNLLQSRASAPVSRSLKTITLLPLTQNETVSDYCYEFSKELSADSSVLMVSPDRLTELKAPVKQLAHDGNVPDGLRHWLSDQEDENDFVLYRCSPGDSPWTRFAIRQSDIVLMVADSGDDPAKVLWEPEEDTANITASGRKALILLQDDRLNISNTSCWLEGRQLNFHLHMEKGRKQDVQRAVRVVTGKATGLVIGGGAARGLAAVGVFKALVEAGMDIDWVGGTSIGSIMAGAIATGLEPDQAIENCRLSFKVGKPFGDFTFPLISLLRGNRMKRLLHQYLD
ncbi:MAG: cyclic nucleotide-binding domain-containing protein, partial [Gammaproteobacteria bacterium]|nr:cyclic nucleotide-binding domain-containing protein [Gammaproteobacteria bacterium]